MDTNSLYGQYLNSAQQARDDGRFDLAEAFEAAGKPEYRGVTMALPAGLWKMLEASPVNIKALIEEAVIGYLLFNADRTPNKKAIEVTVTIMLNVKRKEASET